MSEQMWMERAQSAEAQLITAKSAYEPVLEKVKTFKTNFGIKEKSNGEIDIDYDKFVNNLGVGGALELRSIIDATYNISGEMGEKPRVKVTI